MRLFWTSGAGAVALGLSLAGSAAAQELTYQPINPSFGGNPFNSDHLLSIATAQRPERPRTEQEQRELSETEQFARQLQSRLLSALSSSLVEAITGAAPGTVGEFVVGDQTIAFERTLTTIRLTITNNLTGEVTDIVVPVLNFAQGGGIIGGAPTPSSSQSTMALGALAPTTPLEPRPLVGGRVEGPPAPQPGLGGDLVF